MISRTTARFALSLVAAILTWRIALRLVSSRQVAALAGVLMWVAPLAVIWNSTVERGFRAGGFAVPKDLTRADYRASWSKMLALLKKMHEAGIPIVAGTDGAGIELVHELEIYEQAGFTAAEALSAATIVPARLVGQDAHTGSIKVGKTADLALVEGDPSKQIGTLRQTRVVMLDGKMLDADALRKAAGYSGRPH